MSQKDKMIASNESELQKLMARISQQEHASLIQLQWRMGRPAMERMTRVCSAVLKNNTVYFSAGYTCEMYSYNLDGEVWSTLPGCPNRFSTFAVVDNLVTAIGGTIMGSQKSNELYSLNQQAQQHIQWVEKFPPMPTKRCLATAFLHHSRPHCRWRMVL